MCKKNDMNLSLNGDTFSIMKEQFDSVLARTVGNMQMKGADDATITLKLSISIEKENRSTPDGTIEATIPKFKHDISSVMQVKDKVSGELVGDYQLVWDDDEQKYVMRKIDNGQINMFDAEDLSGQFVDADYKEIPELPEGQKALPASEYGEVIDVDDMEEIIEQNDRYDESTPFGWLAQFVGEDMHVTEAMGNYTVRTSSNKVVLSSATAPNNPFYCAAEKLKDHVKHKLVCAGYGEEDLVVISIQCAECGDAIFTLIAPGATEDEVMIATGSVDSINEDSEEEDGSNYEYDPPEE